MINGAIQNNHLEWWVAGYADCPGGFGHGRIPVLPCLRISIPKVRSLRKTVCWLTPNTSEILRDGVPVSYIRIIR